MSSRSIVSAARSGETGKIVSAHEAVRLIDDGDTVASGGFAGIGFAEEIIAIKIEKAFLASDDELASLGKPRNLTLGFAPHIFGSEEKAKAAVRETVRE
jgi:propionate CoA-transferase